MRKLSALLLSLAVAGAAFAEDAAKFANYKRYADSNKKIIETKAYPRVVMMGNSITQHWVSGYPVMFANNPDIVGRGISGQTTSQMLLRFRQDVIDLHPQVVVINGGINDIAENTGAYNPQVTLANIISMAQLAKANGIEPVLTSVTPAAGAKWRPSVTDFFEKIQNLNKEIKAYADANGFRYIDYHPALLNEEGNGMKQELANDTPALHPNAAGYAAMESVLLPELLPSTVFSGYQGKHHVQGIAVDVKRGCIYFSFTTRLIKTDLRGNLIGSVDGLTGHLGCLTVNPADGRIYGSIEYKDDKIGVGIAGEAAKNRESAFYIAIFDGSKITRPDMKPTDNNVMSTVYLGNVVKDYYAKVKNQGKTVDHRYGCSGIDGVSFGPKPGKTMAEPVLYVAYGIYGDTERTDNDYQVLLTYDTSDWKKYERPLEQDNPHHSGPAKYLNRYFVYTGNTNWGIQNLDYDPDTNSLLAAVYKGKKSDFPNFSLFSIDLDNPAKMEKLRGFDSKEKGLVLPLRKMGIFDEKSNTYGWHFKDGATGICCLGNGLFYISRNSSKPQQSSTITLYRWNGQPDGPFVKR